MNLEKVDEKFEDLGVEAEVDAEAEVDGRHILERLGDGEASKDAAASAPVVGAPPTAPSSIPSATVAPPPSPPPPPSFRSFNVALSNLSVVLMSFSSFRSSSSTLASVTKLSIEMECG